ncbi:YsnF/AvaK domain-containing protein [Tundrisphaera sp. TA3]|uniref:YsnF/AvaK domain-containing protein n=1 Tax=Tundrisphaera sp. TA3 TaxID=3435775 RepID=UPI003EBD24B1
MAIKTAAVVRGKNGLVGQVEAFLAHDDEEAESVAIRLDDGRRVVIPAELLVLQEDGSYALELSASAIEQLIGKVETSEVGGRAGAEVVVPVVAESVEVGKRTVETGRVRIHKTVRTVEEVVDEPLVREEVDVERVPVGRVVEGPVGNRQEGDTLIVPILEEVLVVEKRLMLKEELRITRRKVEHRSPESVTLRVEEATVERIDGPRAAGPGNVDKKS